MTVFHHEHNLSGWPDLSDHHMILVCAGRGGRSASERGDVSTLQRCRRLWGWVDSNLLASSHDRKYLAFQLFTILLPSIR